MKVREKSVIKTQDIENGPTKKEPEAKWSKQSAYTIGIIFLWFFCAVSISNTNKWIFKTLEFKYPVFVTTGHMIFSCAASGLYLKLNGGGRVPSGKTLQRVWLLAVVFILSVVASNIGLKHVYVSFAMTVGATSPAFTVIFSRLVTKKKYHTLVYVSIVPMVTGIFLASKGEMNFDMTGFICCTLGVVFRATKSVVQQLLLTDPSEKLNSIELLYYMSQPCIVITAVWCYWTESSQILVDPVRYQHDVWFFVALSCVLAVGMNLTTFLVTFLTSAVTLQVLGQAKVVMTILLSLAIFQNHVTPLAALGCGTTIMGAMMYSQVKSLKP